MPANLRMTEKEFGFTHKFIFPINSNLSWVTGVRLKIIDNGTVKLNITTDWTISNNIINWAVQNTQTDFSGKKMDGILILTGSTRREEVVFSATFEATKE